MSTVYLQKTEDREAFVRRAFEELDVPGMARGKTVLLKPNIVSHEGYPTTTHPATLETCIALLQGVAARVVVGDGPAWDAGDTEYIVETHALKGSCDRLGVPIYDLSTHSPSRIKTRSFELEVSRLPFDCDLIISLPVLKVHGICGITGALKNVLGILSAAEKRRLHPRGDVHRIIAELNQVVVPAVHIVDAVHTLRVTNELRHGGKLESLGYMLAGTDPVSLDALGLELLKRVEPRFKAKGSDDIRHLKLAAQLGVGEPGYRTVEW